MANAKFAQASHDFAKSNGSDPVPDVGGPSLTRQEFAEECDINNLMKRYEGHGQTINYLMSMPAQGGSYVDFADLPQDLMGYMKFMADAERAFMTLPATIRKTFDNDPVQFVDYASDPENAQQLVDWGLAEAEKPPEPPPAAREAAPPAPAAAPPAPSSSPPTGS